MINGYHRFIIDEENKQQVLMQLNSLLVIVMCGRYGVRHMIKRRNTNSIQLHFVTFKSKIQKPFLVEYLQLWYKRQSNGTFQIAGHHWSIYWFSDQKKQTYPKLKLWHFQLLRSEFLTRISIFSSLGICTKRYICKVRLCNLQPGNKNLNSAIKTYI